EARLVVPALEAVAARVLRGRPADGQLVRRLELVEDNRAVATRRAEDGGSASTRRRDEGLQAVGGGHACLGGRQRRRLLRRASRRSGEPTSGASRNRLRDAVPPRGRQTAKGAGASGARALPRR